MRGLHLCIRTSLSCFIARRADAWRRNLIEIPYSYPIAVRDTPRHSSHSDRSCAQPCQIPADCKRW